MSVLWPTEGGGLMPEFGVESQVLQAIAELEAQGEYDFDLIEYRRETK